MPQPITVIGIRITKLVVNKIRILIMVEKLFYKLESR